MKILFLMIQMPDDPGASGMYIDLAGEFVDNGHDVTVMAPDVDHKSTFLNQERGMNVLRIKTIPVLGVKNMFRKGIGLALLPFQFKRAYKKYLRNNSFDWVFMPTPPITLAGFVDYMKRKTNAKLYLILRDIHPQSSASIGLIKNRFSYNYLAGKAAKAYEIADLIGCMSQGNIDFIAANYPDIEESKLVLLMNWQKYEDIDYGKTDIREKYNLKDKFIVLFGGNIGLGQKIENIIILARHYLSTPEIIFVIIGKGVKKDDLERIALKEDLHNILFMDFMPRNDYLEFVRSVDLGLISINENYKVPTCPSKIVSYMSMKIPVLAIINPDNDYGKIIEDAGAGFWAVGGDEKRIFALFDKILNDKVLRKKMGENGYQFYLNNLTSRKAFNKIIEQIYRDGKA